MTRLSEDFQISDQHRRQMNDAATKIEHTIKKQKKLLGDFRTSLDLRKILEFSEDAGAVKRQAHYVIMTLYNIMKEDIKKPGLLSPLVDKIKSFIARLKGLQPTHASSFLGLSARLDQIIGLRVLADLSVEQKKTKALETISKLESLISIQEQKYKEWTSHINQALKSRNPDGIDYDAILHMAEAGLEASDIALKLYFELKPEGKVF